MNGQTHVKTIDAAGALLDDDHIRLPRLAPEQRVRCGRPSTERRRRVRRSVPAPTTRGLHPAADFIFEAGRHTLHVRRARTQQFGEGWVPGGQYENRQGWGAARTCLGDEHFWVGHEAALGVGYPTAGQCVANPLIGEPIAGSAPNAGRRHVHVEAHPRQDDRRGVPATTTTFGVSVNLRVEGICRGRGDCSDAERSW